MVCFDGGNSGEWLASSMGNVMEGIWVAMFDCWNRIGGPGVHEGVINKWKLRKVLFEKISTTLECAFSQSRNRVESKQEQRDRRGRGGGKLAGKYKHRHTLVQRLVMALQEMSMQASVKCFLALLYKFRILMTHSIFHKPCRSATELP